MKQHPLKPMISHLDYRKLYHQMKESGHLSNPQTQRELAYIRGYRDFRFFVSYFFPHYCTHPFSRMHLDFFVSQQEPGKRGQKVVIAAPRGHAKTTFMVLFKIIHALAYQYDPYILVVCQSEIEAKDRVTQIYEELQTNARLRDIFGLLVKDSKTAGLKRSFTTIAGMKVEAVSIGQQIRGKKHKSNRPTLVILDDVETLESAYSPQRRENLKNWLHRDVLPCGQIDGSTNFTVIGTRIHSESLLSDLLKNSLWIRYRYQAVICFHTNEALWNEWRQILTDLSNPHAQAHASVYFEDNKEAMLEGTEVLWPEADPYDSLMQQMVMVGEAAFNSEKQNEPFDRERQIFDMDNAKYVRIDFDTKMIYWLDGSEKAIPLNNLKRTVAFHDPASGSKPNEARTDYAAIVVVGQDKDGYCYVLDCYLEKSPLNIQIEQTCRLYQQWAFDALYVEENHSEDQLKPLYENHRILFPINRNLYVVGVHQSANKIQRISTLQPDIANGQLLFRTDLNPRFFDQLRLFPTTHEDGPDALQGAMYQLKSKAQFKTSSVPMHGAHSSPTQRLHARARQIPNPRRPGAR